MFGFPSVPKDAINKDCFLAQTELGFASGFRLLDMIYSLLGPEVTESHEPLAMDTAMFRVGAWLKGVVHMHGMATQQCVYVCIWQT